MPSLYLFFSLMPECVQHVFNEYELVDTRTDFDEISFSSLSFSEFDDISLLHFSLLLGPRSIFVGKKG